MKVGDKVVCVVFKIKDDEFIDGFFIHKLIKDKIYTIEQTSENEILLDEGIRVFYNKKRFKLLSEIRKEKLKKLMTI